MYLRENMCHELMHNIENRMTSEDVSYFENWYKYNPRNFYYTYNYQNYESDGKYTKIESDVNNVYFVDDYSQTYETEDKARIFENVCGVDSNSTLNDYPNLYKNKL